MSKIEYPVVFTIDLAPITKKNSQRMIRVTSKETKKTRMIPYPSSQYKKYSKACAAYMPSIDGPIKDYVNICARYYLAERRPTDLTNLNEALHDILTDYGVIIDDDNLCVGATDGSRVFYDKEHPRTEVEITLLDENKAWDAISRSKKQRSKIRKSTKSDERPDKLSKNVSTSNISFDAYLYSKGLDMSLYDQLDPDSKMLLRDNYENLYFSKKE